MSKYLLEDIVRVKNPKENPRKESKKNSTKEIGEKKDIGNKSTNYTKSRSRYMLWFTALASVTFCLFALSFLFGRAEVIVDQQIKNVVLNENLSASKDPGNNVLPFDLVVIPGEESTTVKTSAEKDVKEVATGTVIIYNDFSSSPQTLDIDTRLEGSNGKIYKTQIKNIIPGKSENGTPGSIEVKIYGANAGVEYNSAPLDFKIFGFKNTPKYAKFYGRSKGEISGGFVGKAPAISDQDKTTIVNNLKTTLQTKLLKKATDQIPSGFVLFKNATFLDIGDINIPFTAKDNNLIITLKGTLYGILFNEQKLTKKIAEDNIEKYDGSEVFMPNIRDLTFSLYTSAGLSDKDDSSFDNMKNINFNLSGSTKIVWKLDVNKFTKLLLGKSKADFNKILSQYPNINSANLTLTPIWKMSIPDEAKDIKVIVNYPK